MGMPFYTQQDSGQKKKIETGVARRLLVCFLVAGQLRPEINTQILY